MCLEEFGKHNSDMGIIATAHHPIKTVGAKHSGDKSLSKSHKLSTRMLCATRRLRQRPYPGIMP